MKCGIIVVISASDPGPAERNEPREEGGDDLPECWRREGPLWPFEAGRTDDERDIALTHTLPHSW